jgi:hypothetical protein
MRPSATSISGLKLLVYAAFSTSISGLKLLVHAAFTTSISGLELSKRSTQRGGSPCSPPLCQCLLCNTCTHMLLNEACLPPPPPPSPCLPLPPSGSAQAWARSVPPALAPPSWTGAATCTCPRLSPLQRRAMHPRCSPGIRQHLA